MRRVRFWGNRYSRSHLELAPFPVELIFWVSTRVNDALLVVRDSLKCPKLSKSLCVQKIVDELFFFRFVGVGVLG